MRSAKKLSVYLFTSALVLVPAAAITACGDDDTNGGTGGVVLLEAGSDARSNTDGQATDAKTDAPITPIDSGNKDVNQPENEAGSDAGSDADADAAMADADADADAATADADAGNDADADAGSKPTSLDNATYKITAWTCNGTKDVLAFAGTAGIGEIDLTVAATSKLDVLYSGGDCDRSNTIVITYPQDGQVTTTSTVSDTCSGTCTPQQCNPATVEPVLIDTFDYTKTSTTFTGTRSFPSGRASTLAGLAGCAQGDTESVTYTKK